LSVERAPVRAQGRSERGRRGRVARDRGARELGARAKRAAAATLCRARCIAPASARRVSLEPLPLELGRGDARVSIGIRGGIERGEARRRSVAHVEHESDGSSSARARARDVRERRSSRHSTAFLYRRQNQERENAPRSTRRRVGRRHARLGVQRLAARRTRGRAMARRARRLV